MEAAKPLTKCKLGFLEIFMLELNSYIYQLFLALVANILLSRFAPIYYFDENGYCEHDPNVSSMTHNISNTPSQTPKETTTALLLQEVFLSGT